MSFLVRAIADQVPTYSYRRLTALLNRSPRPESEPAGNVKRMLRIIQHNDLTLEQYMAYRPGHTHDSFVVAMRSGASSTSCSNQRRIYA